jgi:hypothetical protein
MQTSGLVLDVYDDFNGATLRELYPRFDQIPGHVKQAHVVTAEDRQQLPDDVFALVMLNNGEKLRKYACIDAGNTALSVEYFLKNAHKLPVEAQQIAAENLKTACAWYDLTPPEPLEKIALGVGTALTALTAIPTIQGTANTIKENRTAQKALQAQGNALVTPQMRNEFLGRKMAEASGTTLMPSQPPSDPSAALKSKTVVNKTASIGRLISASKGDTDVPPDLVQPPTKEQAGSHPQAQSLRPTVDVSNKEPPKVVVEKKASRYALPTLQKYPLDSYAQVKAASAYFDTYVRHMVPEMRREFAVNLVKSASALALPVSDVAQKYGADDFAPEHEIKAAFDARRLEVAHNADALALLGEVEKVARFRMWKEASAQQVQSFTAAEVAGMLAEFDKVAGLDHHYDRTIPDPYYSVYGFEKEAQEPEFSEVIGNELVTEADLKRLSRIAAHTVKLTFGGDFQEEFLKDPVGIFKSLPLDQKKMIMRIANSTQPGAERTYY